LLLEELLQSDKSSDVRVTILNAALRDGRSLTIDALQHIMIGQEQELQKKALEVISATGDRREIKENLVEQLRDWASFIHNSNYEEYCSLCHRFGGNELVLRLAETRSDLAVVPLNVLINKGFRTGWNDLSILTQDGDASTVAVVLDLLSDETDQDAVVWLLDILAKSMTDENKYDRGWSEARYRALPKVYSMLCGPVEPRQTPHALPVLQMLQGELSYVLMPDLDDTWDNGDTTSRIEYYKGFIDKLKRWS